MSFDDSFRSARKNARMRPTIVAIDVFQPGLSTAGGTNSKKRTTLRRCRVQKQTKKHVRTAREKQTTMTAHSRTRPSSYASLVSDGGETKTRSMRMNSHAMRSVMTMKPNWSSTGCSASTCTRAWHRVAARWSSVTGVIVPFFLMTVNGALVLFPAFTSTSRLLLDLLL